MEHNIRYNDRVRWRYWHGKQSQRRQLEKFGTVSKVGLLFATVLLDGSKNKRKIPVKELSRTIPLRHE